MLGKNSGQLHIHDSLVYLNIIPQNHLLLKLNESFSFDFIYDLVEDKYSEIGRESIDPVMITKMFFLEYLYKLSDVEVVQRTQTDVAFRWFLKLSLADKVPDDTTLSYFRVHRLGIESYETLFNEIINQCMKKNLIKIRRFQVDSTNVDANVNYPSTKKLLRQSFERVIKYTSKLDETLAKESLKELEEELASYHSANTTFLNKEYYNIVEKHLNNLYIKIHTRIDKDNDLQNSFDLCITLIDQLRSKSGDEIVSIVDQEARVAHKSRGNIKRGYKNSIIIDEDSELILASITTPFNVNDSKMLPELVEKVDNNFSLHPNELSADKGYATTLNRSYLMDHQVTSNMAFYNETKTEKPTFTAKDCEITDDGNHLTCPNGIYVETFKKYEHNNTVSRRFKVNSQHCIDCPKRVLCHGKKIKPNQKKLKYFSIADRYDAIIKDKKRTKTNEFNEAMNARYIIERRFATGVRNHDMRRTKYIGLIATTKHVIMSNLSVNFIRAINILYPKDDGGSASKINQVVLI